MVIAEVTVVVGNDEKEVSVVGGVTIVVEEAVEEAVEEVVVAVDVLLGVVDVSFVVVCGVEIAGLTDVVFAHGEATKCMQNLQKILMLRSTCNNHFPFILG